VVPAACGTAPMPGWRLGPKSAFGAGGATGLMGALRALWAREASLEAEAWGIDKNDYPPPGQPKMRPVLDSR
jgi:hypothetical protein